MTLMLTKDKNPNSLEGVSVLDAVIEEKSETIPVPPTVEEAHAVAASEIWPTAETKARKIVSNLFADLAPYISGPIRIRILRGEKDTDYFSDK